MEIREMRLSDLPRAMELDALCLPVPWSEEVWRAELASLLGLNLVAEEDGRITGQICSKAILDELHITTIAVHPDRRRSGIGRSLIEETIERTPQVETVVLEVRVGNGAAISFYENLGFRRAGTRPRYYGDEDAFVMVLDVSGRPLP